MLKTTNLGSHGHLLPTSSVDGAKPW